MHQCLWLDPESHGRLDQIGLMTAEEFQNRRENAFIGQAVTQIFRRHPGQAQQPFGALLVNQDPAQRLERQRSRIGIRGLGFAKNCQLLSVRPKECRMAKRILVVEDNDLNRKLFCDVLRSQGYAVEPVADGREALERAREFVPNLIIMDIQMPEVSGLDLIEEAKADVVLRLIPVLAVTAYAGKGDEERIRDAGAEGYLAKPVSIGQFMAAVKALVERALP